MGDGLKKEEEDNDDDVVIRPLNPFTRHQMTTDD